MNIIGDVSNNSGKRSDASYLEMPRLTHANQLELEISYKSRFRGASPESFTKEPNSPVSHDVDIQSY
jgi:hypothetical protein